MCCAARTASANAPPPGTMTTRPAHAATAPVQRRRSSEAAQLPPTLMTVSPLRVGIMRRPLRRDLRIALALRRMELTHHRAFGRPLAHDLDADRARTEVELLDRHGDADHPVLSQDERGDPLGERLD